MSAEVIAVLAVGVSLAALTLTALRRMETRTETRIGALAAEIRATRTELKAEIRNTQTDLQATRTELKAEIQAARTELKAEIRATKTDLEARIADAKTDLEARIAVAALDPRLSAVERGQARTEGLIAGRAEPEETARASGG